jgi:hypothetical protein
MYRSSISEDDVLEVLFPSDLSEDCDDVDADPDFVPGSSDDEECTIRKRKRNVLPVFSKSDPSFEPSYSSDEDDTTTSKPVKPPPTNDPVPFNAQAKSEVCGPTPSTSSQSEAQVNALQKTNERCNTSLPSTSFVDPATFYNTTDSSVDVCGNKQNRSKFQSDKKQNKETKKKKPVVKKSVTGKKRGQMKPESV